MDHTETVEVAGTDWTDVGGEEVKTTSIILRTCKNEVKLGQEIKTHEWLKGIYADLKK